MKISEEKLNQLVCDCKVADELMGRVLEMNFDLEKIGGPERYFASNSDFFRILERRNEMINEISSILNRHGSYHFDMVRVHKIDCMAVVSRQITAIRRVQETIEIASELLSQQNRRALG